MFDGAKVFGAVAAIAVGGCILAPKAVWVWAAIGAAVGLYYLLSFCNALERRDINDAEERRKQKSKRKG
jgi:hypothetical protein